MILRFFQILFLLFSVSLSQTFAQPFKTDQKANRKLISIELNGNGWKAVTDNGSIFITPYTETIWEVRYSPDGSGVSDSSNAVVMKPLNVAKKTSSIAGAQLLESGGMNVFVHNNPFYLAFIYKGDTLLRESTGFNVDKNESSVSFKISPNEAIYGTGERALAMNRRGYQLPLYNRPSYGYQMGTASLNYSIPMVLSSKKYAVLWDNPQKGFVDIGKTQADVLEWNAIGGTARYFVIAAGDYPGLMKSYTDLTGRQPLLPRWALGNLQSRMAYRNQQETDSIVSLMQKHDFPIDAIILDFYWFGDSIKGHLGTLDWHKNAWPHPQEMIAKFRRQGIKTILITEPYVIDTVKTYADADSKKIFVTDSLGNTYVDKYFYFGHGSLIDIFKPEAREWFWKKYQKQINIGVAAWWGDLGEPESHPSDIFHVNGKADAVHNIYGHNWDKMLSDKYAENYPHTRLFHLQRSGFAGSQRFSAFPWTGDVSRSWGGLQAQLPLLLTMGMNGLGYIHSDAGGFAMGEKDDELYTRWLQFATFTPILRPHGSGIPSEPVFFSLETQRIVRNSMKLRYAMLPYNYTLAWQNSENGAPLMRPLFYYFPDDSIAGSVENEYFWGDNILVAPVIEKGLKVQKIYLPSGQWYDFNSGKRYSGNQWINYSLTMEYIPFFVKAGSFIPMTTPLKTTDNYTSDEFIVRYYPEGRSQFIQYEDDGWDKLAMKEGNYELISYNGNQTKGHTVINLSKKGSWKGMPKIRRMTFEVWNNDLPKKVLINGKEILKSKSGKNNKSYYQMEDNRLRIHFVWDGKPQKVEIVN